MKFFVSKKILSDFVTQLAGWFNRTAACLLALVLWMGGAVAGEARPPDIVFFLADDWGRDAGVYAQSGRITLSDFVETPTIDRMAREGVRFNNAFYDAPQCAPSRAAIVTGRAFWRNGAAAIQRGGSWEGVRNSFRESPRFPDLLSDRGYLTARAFKTLPFQPSSEEASIEGIDQFLRYGLHVSAATTPTERTLRRAMVLQQTRDAIRQVVRACRPDEPFFFVFGPINTHRPFAPGSGEALWGIDIERLRDHVPPHLPDVEAVRRDLADYLGEVQALDLMLGVLIEELQAIGRWDETLLVLAGDNGAPGFPRSKAQLYDMGMAAPLIVRWPGKVGAGRVVDDFVNLRDLAPTFLEVAGCEVPSSMDGRSLLPQLLATRSGQIDPTRDAVVYGRERHYVSARDGNLPYPSRAVRTADFLYIRNFRPERWPLGKAYGIDAGQEVDLEMIGDYWRLAEGPFRDLDPSLTKQWLIAHRNDSSGSSFYEIAFGKQPAEELYDLRVDPGQMVNVAAETRYATVRQNLSLHLETVMQELDDPRLHHAFDAPPYVEKLPASAQP